ncbi:MAG: prephenate dehydrogenase/arogenate dehydrogenase family protein [Lachnospiraceae bacterium]|nr:prephenate dehydrogenase/arogenate dehydrogenase family protein [Lachnospiraceae bacterium]
MAIETIGFIGLGLIGGSLAKTIRRVYPGKTLIGYNRSKASLAAALKDGTLNQAQDAIDESFAACDMIFLCAPVSVNIRCMEKLREIVKPGCILTDVGSVKTTIHEAVEELGLTHQFIGGHPMAGSERFGYAHAEDRLLENAYYILTPTGETPDWMLEEYRNLVTSIGSLPIVMDYREHDRVTAAISHLPHVIAYTLVNLVKRSDSPEGMMRKLAAGGFKDLTRIASSSPDMWQQICQENRTALADVLHEYRQALAEMEEAIRRDDGTWLWNEFEEARVYRDAMPQASGDERRTV